MHFKYCCCCSVTKVCLTLCDSFDCSTPGLREFAQTHVHWVDDAIQSPHPLSPFSSCPQSFWASGYFPMSPLFTSGGQTTGASASVPPVNNQCWFPLGLTDLISLHSKGLSRIFSSTIWSINSSTLSHLYGPTYIINVYWKNHSFDYTKLCWQVMSLLFNTLSGFVILNIMKTNTYWINRFSWKHQNWEKTVTTVS